MLDDDMQITYQESYHRLQVSNELLLSVGMSMLLHEFILLCNRIIFGVYFAEISF